MKNQIQKLLQDTLEALKSVQDEKDLDAIRVKLLGRSGELTVILRSMKDLNPEERKVIGQMANETKEIISKAIDDALTDLKARILAKQLRAQAVDVTLPGRRKPRGSIHPLTTILEEIVVIFERMGFVWEDGPEVEDDYHNFTALNFPFDHPARDMQDTFFIQEPDILLRTHTSPVQIRVMLRQKPPIRMISPGWVYRCDTIDPSHMPMFSQVEGLLVDEGITFGDLKGVLNEFARRLFGEEIATRFRPSFFPFTEPSAELDVQCTICGGSGRKGEEVCRVCNGSGWKEILGSGMVDPNVLENVGYDSEKYTGFAFGLGVERVSLFKYGINDMRLFFESDLRFLNQF